MPQPDVGHVVEQAPALHGWPFVLSWFCRHWVAFWFAALSAYWLFLIARPGSALMADVYLVATRRHRPVVDPIRRLGSQPRRSRWSR